MRLIQTLRFFVPLVFCGYLAGAQTLPMPRNIKAAYAKGTRSASGKPGARYWQNRADYSIDVQFDPQTRMVRGSETIRYVNNSPDTLGQLWFKIYPNLYQRGVQRNSRIAPSDEHGGVVIDSIWVDNTLVQGSRRRNEGTNMVLSGQRILAGATTEIRLRWSYPLNEGSHVRTGQVEPGAYFIAYFFPRIAVYDDVDGWNRIPYTGNLEFYNDFGRFDVAITVPKNYLVWATGDLKNASEVLQPVYAQRLQKAEREDALVMIVDTPDLGKPITANKDWLTWRFQAEKVPDFAFATSDHYLWQSSSLVVDSASRRRTRVDAAFNPKHADYFHVAGDARKTVEVMSFVFPKWPFPYSHISVFDGLDQMEYPMMVNDNPVESRMESITLTDHEVFHTMFPFYLGINETKYAWMDEGWATIGEWIVSPLIDSTIVDDYGVQPYSLGGNTEEDLPIITVSTQTNGTAYFLNAYAKPAFAYLYLKEILGEPLFTKALHHYIATWQGRHPTPYDFFASMNAGAGRDLDWYWKRWFFDNSHPDLAIRSVKRSGKNMVITVQNQGGKPVPIHLQITMANGKTQEHRTPADIWKNRSVHTITLPANSVWKSVQLGSTYTPDTDPSNNRYEVR